MSFAYASIVIFLFFCIFLFSQHFLYLFNFLLSSPALPQFGSVLIYLYDTFIYLDSTPFT